MVLLRDICCIVRYVFFLRDICLLHSNEDHASKLEKKGISRLSLYGRMLNFLLVEAKSQWGNANYRRGGASHHNLSTGYIFIHGLWPCFITTIPQRCEINISC